MCVNAQAQLRGVILTPEAHNAIYRLCKSSMPQVPNTRSRGWCFTINNPTVGDELAWETLKFESLYCVKGLETGSEGTPHWQGYVYFKHPKSLRGVKRILERAHLEPQRGTSSQAIDYCKKDGNFEEFGQAPLDVTVGLSKKQQWQQIIEWAETNQLKMIKENYPGIYLRYYEKLRSLSVGSSSILEDLDNEWWWGPTGTGKSRLLWSRYPEHFQKELNKWWCGYLGEDVVAIEEWCPKNECTASALKIWADRYPFTGQIKGGSLRRIRPKKIIITSNYSIDQCFPNEEDREPIKRRFKEVKFDTPIVFVPGIPETLDEINDFLNQIQ